MQRLHKWQIRFIIKKKKFKENPFCHYCGSEMWMVFDQKKAKGGNKRQATVDHIIPKGCGGSDNPDNLVICCRECNDKRKRIDYDLFVWAMKQGPAIFDKVVKEYEFVNRYRNQLKQKSIFAYI